ncbi:hypothetical protein PHMEG_0004712 [Phytophthora megakarya]|uniref:Uncharacterized protein n=1 Tax=Phytophthora megakarya TaxID=4795 RepID=A0A225WT06_9STRA|nr:hypothetical protein PHMEG_0004712 [Phytophthora megakarya]
MILFNLHILWKVDVLQWLVKHDQLDGEGPASRGGKVKVKLVLSGRWTEEQVQTIEVTQDELNPRAVSDEEALDGVGTFVGSAICTSRVRPGGARVWDCGFVVVYKWSMHQLQGWLDVTFNGSEVAILYSPESTQDVAVEVYSLQPCSGNSPSLVTAMKMKDSHVYNAFNGIGRTATRDAKALLNAVGGKAIDESKAVPRPDISTLEVSEIPVRHILDYVFYKEGGRVQPAGVSFGDKIFDIGAVGVQDDPLLNSGDTGVVLSDGLSDSEDDLADRSTGVRTTGPAQQPTLKRRKLEASAPVTRQTSADNNIPGTT